MPDSTLQRSFKGGRLLPSPRNASLRPFADEIQSVGSQRTSARLSLLGGFVLETSSGCLRLPLHAQRLVAFLELQGTALHRTYVAGRLWTEHDQEHAQACLRTTLWRIGLLPVAVVDATSTHLALDSSVASDLRELEGCAERILGGNAVPREGDFARLARSGELLPDWYDDWIPQERERVRQLHLFALEAVGNELIEAQRYSEASIAALAAVGADPLRESAYRLLIRSYLGLGNVAEALRQFGVFRKRLQQELGLQPSPQIQELLAGIH
jgi:DNA-binding SARP family transcriptional activator